MSAGLHALLRMGRNTLDLDRAVAFYHDVLGFRIEAMPAKQPSWTRLPGRDLGFTRCALLSLGGQQLELTECPQAAAYPADVRSNDRMFQHFALVVKDMAGVHTRVMAAGIQAITQGGPQTLPPETGAVTAFKFRDPDGHPVELLQFPPGAGDPHWHQQASTDLATLGIDHSAISVLDPSQSIAFYTQLGLQLGSRGRNHGMAQEHLDHLPQPDVEVIAIRPDNAPPHLELLGYRQPLGRDHIATALTAIAADRLEWRAEQLDTLLARPLVAEAVISRGVVEGEPMAILRDPDGHLLILHQAS